jgi:CubicO group peptidase (beta-lactamase class C family)
MRFALLLCIALLLAACARGPIAPAQPDYWPTTGWRSALPEEHGFDSATLAALDAAAPPYLDGLLVIRDGYIVYERYFNEYDADSLHDIASVAKSWTSALVGVARAQGHLANLDATLPQLLPSYFAAGLHADKQAITLRHLLMMRSGIAFDQNALNSGEYGEDADLIAGDLTAIALDFPLAHPPGAAWNYSTLDTQLIATVMREATGMPLSAFAEEQLFGPMGIGATEWVADATGGTIAGQNVRMTPRDMAKLGLLYLHGGVWEGRQLVPADWVRESTTPQGEALYVPTGQVEPIRFYGYQWWLWDDSWFNGMSEGVHAQGHAGQNVLILPRLNMIVVTTATLSVPLEQVEAQHAGLHALIIEYILPSVRPR